MMANEKLNKLLEKKMRNGLCKTIIKYCKIRGIWGEGNIPFGNVLVSFGVKPKLKKCKECGRELNK